jgi:hypothetical protein
MDTYSSAHRQQDKQPGGAGAGSDLLALLPAALAAVMQWRPPTASGPLARIGQCRGSGRGGAPLWLGWPGPDGTGRVGGGRRGLGGYFGEGSARQTRTTCRGSSGRGRTNLPQIDGEGL